MITDLLSASTVHKASFELKMAAQREARLYFLLSRGMHILPYTTAEASRAVFIQRRERTKNSLQSQICHLFVDLARHPRVFQKPW